jgi:hypothetical protein
MVTAGAPANLHRKDRQPRIERIGILASKGWEPLHRKDGHPCIERMGVLAAGGKT